MSMPLINDVNSGSWSWQGSSHIPSIFFCHLQNRFCPAYTMQYVPMCIIVCIIFYFSRPMYNIIVYRIPYRIVCSYATVARCFADAELRTTQPEVIRLVTIWSFIYCFSMSAFCFKIPEVRNSCHYSKYSEDLMPKPTTLHNMIYHL